MIELPIEAVEPSIIDPRVLLLYSFPKIGKTPCLAQLPKCLILDLEGGTDAIKAVKVTIIGLTHKRAIDGGPETEEQLKARHATKRYYLSEVIAQLRSFNPYRYLAVDTVSKLQLWCEEDALYMYMKTTIGKYYNRYTDEDYQLSGGACMPGALKPRNQWQGVLELPKGAGYYYLQLSVRKWLGYLKELTPTLIISGHVKLNTLVNKLGKEVEGKDLDLMGKIKTDVTGLISDAVGYVHREGNKNFVSFQPLDEVRCGCRIPHLEGKDLLLSEKLEDGTIKTYWKNIFKEL